MLELSNGANSLGEKENRGNIWIQINPIFDWNWTMERFSLRVHLEENVSHCIGSAVIRLLVMKHRAVLSSVLRPIFHRLRPWPLTGKSAFRLSVIKWILNLQKAATTHEVYHNVGGYGRNRHHPKAPLLPELGAGDKMAVVCKQVVLKHSWQTC